ncbi:E3 ubiquitin-protein ligase MYLIP-A [Stylophora pistillata]|uniref:E3 ubiquitin-protein ligase MYLIP-A n=1 Tax=Stylophora pistillata TaxID=50429 RepID=A0A2B4SSX5_STYPI|nr:E3 ubiquitin-protein ligase MYLIP-A [Stylophora pistillata]
MRMSSAMHRLPGGASNAETVIVAIDLNMIDFFTLGAASNAEPVNIDEEMEKFELDQMDTSVDDQQASLLGQLKQREQDKDQRIVELQKRNADLERQILEANIRGENDVLCMMCCERKRDVVFLHEDLSIRHSCCCSECAARLNSCPICRGEIIHWIPHSEHNSNSDLFSSSVPFKFILVKNF